MLFKIEAISERVGTGEILLWLTWSTPVLSTVVSSTQHFCFYNVFAALLLNFDLPRFCMPLLNFVGTVKPPNRGHFGDGPFVPCREVVLFSEVLF